eukprot:Lankesteria_metandrocarpae@DN5247_c0_g2_i1.p1
MDNLVDELGQLVGPTMQIRDDVLKSVRQFCKWRYPSFPGSQPISFNKQHLQTVARIPYVACEKTDGIRFLCYISGSYTFLVDRTEKVRCLQMHMPQRGNPTQHHRSTLLDGELVLDKIKIKTVVNTGTGCTTGTATTDAQIPDDLLEQEVADDLGLGEEKDDGQTIIDDMGSKGTTGSCTGVEEVEVERDVLRFLIFDAIAMNGETTVSQLNLLHRLKMVYEEVVHPRIEWERENPEVVAEEKKRGHYVEIYLKDFFEVADIPAIISFAPRLPHFSDGIIFTPVDVPYKSGTCQELLKWKPPHLNTVDFVGNVIRGSKDKDVGIRLGVNVNGSLSYHGNVFLGCKPGEEYKFVDIAAEIEAKQQTSPEGKVFLECTFDPLAHTSKPSKDENDKWLFGAEHLELLEGGWLIERMRTDRTTPNDHRVVGRVLQSLEDGVTFATIVRHLTHGRTHRSTSVASRCHLPEYYAQYGSRANKRVATAAAAAGGTAAVNYTTPMIDGGGRT